MVIFSVRLPPLRSYLSCSPAIMTSALCCLAMAFFLLLLARSMFVISGPERKWNSLLVMRLCVYKIAPETHRAPLPCGIDVVYTERKTPTYGAFLPKYHGKWASWLRTVPKCWNYVFMFTCMLLWQYLLWSLWPVLLVVQRSHVLLFLEASNEWLLKSSWQPFANCLHGANKPATAT